MIRELALKNRSYRRFYGEKKIDEKTLRELVDIARNTPSAANRQPLQYRLVCDDETNSRVYDCLGWAGYYKDWDGPVAEERPSAYIIMVTPQDVNPQWDEGIAGQTAVLNLPEGYKVDLCIALGYPKEEVVLEDIAGDGDIHYYRDDNQVQHVPKKKLDDILI